MTFIRGILKPITYWQPLGSDGGGGIAYGACRIVAGRYEEMNERIMADGIEIESSGRAYVDEDLAVGGMLLAGDFCNVTGTDDHVAAVKAESRRRARRIVKFSKIESLTGQVYDRIAYV